MSAVENFILDLEDSQKFLMMELHEIILSHTGVTAHLKWNIPVYETSKYICYLNPMKNKPGIELCFTKGFELDDSSGLLEARNRKMVKGVIIQEISDRLLLDINRLITNAIKLVN